MTKKIENSEGLEKYKILLSTQQHSFQLAGEAGAVVIRSLILINGAAAIAIMALFGNIGSEVGEIAALALQGLGKAGFVFALGAAAGAWAGIFTQKTLLEYVEVINEQMKQISSNEDGDSKTMPPSLEKLIKLRDWAWWVINLSLLLFLVGIFIAARALGLI